MNGVQFGKLVSDCNSFNLLPHPFQEFWSEMLNLN
jgi:hypothetical protein